MTGAANRRRAWRSVGFVAKWVGRGHGAELEAEQVQGIDTSKAHPARMYDYLLGGYFLNPHTSRL